ncbi:Ribonuclease II/R [Gracilaria domingensis]|nr:Ribonuclease II/R [Gracilaria domingensis]
MTTVANSQLIDAGSYLHVRTGSKIRLTRALRPDGKRNWMVRDSSGSQFSVGPKQILFALRSHSVDSISDDLTAIENTIRTRAEEYEELLELSWEELQSETDPVDVYQICLLLFNDENPLSLLTTHFLLENDDMFFKSRNIKGTVMYEARSSKNVEEIKVQRAEQARRYKRDQSRQFAVQNAYSSCSLEPLRSYFSGEEIQTLLSSLRDMALELENGRNEASTRYAITAGNSFSLLGKEARALVQMTMSALSKPIVPLSAFDVLVAWRELSKHENLAILRNGMDKRRKFSATTMESAEKIIANPPDDIDRERRLDLRHLAAYAIDSADTTEVDDAISFDPDSNLVYVHVADPSRYFIKAEDDVLQEAFRRNRTIYLPTEKLTMFPEKLANELFSLTGESWDGTSLSFSCFINQDGSIDEQSMRVQPTFIHRPLRLTYEEASEIIDDDARAEHASLKQIYQLALQRREWREVEGGAIIIDTPFPYVEVKNESTEHPDINIGTVRSDASAWKLVSELMITACTVGAFIAKEANLPLPFRSQEPFDYPDDDVIEALPNGPARAAIVFKNAAPSVTSTMPMEHASLGLDYYSQLTSPIRRSLDLIAHFQLKALIRGEEAPYTVEDIMREIGRTQDIGRDARMVETKTSKYWQLEFLRRKGPNVLHRASFVKTLKDSDRVGLVHFEDYGFQLVATIPPGTKPGTPMGLRIPVVNPRTGEVRAESVLTTEASWQSFDEIQDDDVLSDITEDELC